LKHLAILFLLLSAYPALAAEPLVFSCERTEKNYTEVYELKINASSNNQKAKVFVDGRDLDRSDELGRQTIKSIVITESTVLISMETYFPPENIDGVKYGAGSVMAVTTINRSTGQLSKVETIQGGILSLTLGEGTKTYQEKCAIVKKP
jgi:hypothetical protein